MSPVKQQVLDMAQSLPEDVTLDDILVCQDFRNDPRDRL
jgi:hypothetical protein